MKHTLVNQLTLLRNLHIGIALSGAGWHPGAWAEPGTRPSELLSARYWADQVAEARRGLLDFVTIEDSYRLNAPENEPTKRPPLRAPDPVRGRLDAIMIAARVAPLVPGIGLLPAAITTLTEPFLVSTQIATLDFISGGRAGWLAQVPMHDDDAAYVGPRTVPTGSAALAEADDHIEVVRRLWDSWEDGAEIRDAATNRFIDRDRIHPIDFEGAHFKIKGPSITPRPPQGQPIVAMLGDDLEAREVADRRADIVLLRAGDERSLRANASESTGPHVFADLVVFLDGDRERAVERQQRLDARLPATKQDGRFVFTGTPGELAETLIDWGELGLTGFRLQPAVIPHDLEAVTRGLVPVLQQRGVYRRTYEASTLRGLLGLTRPANRYAPARATEAAATQ
jgi:alkanesulfonate monooxygenase SsuD/methylene tetrahydromethanopterin reductase-like flavin-dependent oxidoreductase (luciferase family)